MKPPAILKTTSADLALANLPGLLPDIETLYTDVHPHPELSMHGRAPPSSRHGACARRATR
jgi:hypothetical protein